jgi:hypothetical protein
VTLIIHDASYDILIKILTLPLSLYITNGRCILLHSRCNWVGGGSSLEELDRIDHSSCFIFPLFYNVYFIFPSPVKSKLEQAMSPYDHILPIIFVTMVFKALLFVIFVNTESVSQQHILFLSMPSGCLHNKSVNLDITATWVTLLNCRFLYRQIKYE